MIICLFASCCLLLVLFTVVVFQILLSNLFFFSVLLAVNGHIEKMQLCQCQQVCFILITNHAQVACT